MGSFLRIAVILVMSSALCKGAFRKLPALSIKVGSRSENLKLRGGGLLSWLDPRTPAIWPMYPKDIIPEDGSVGGHYSMEEICSSSTYVGDLPIPLLI